MNARTLPCDDCNTDTPFAELESYIGNEDSEHLILFICETCRDIRDMTDTVASFQGDIEHDIRRGAKR